MAAVHAAADFEARMATSSILNLSCSNERERFGSIASACVGRNFATESAKSWRRQRRVKLVVCRGTCCGGSSISSVVLGTDCDLCLQYVRGIDLTRLLELDEEGRRNAQSMRKLYLS